jgi:cytochrome bd-type quinol oxidase subunit 1
MPTFLEPDDPEVSSHLMMLGWLSGLYFVEAVAAWRIASSSASCEAEAAFFVQSRDANFLSRAMMVSGTGHGSDDLVEDDE